MARTVRNTTMTPAAIRLWSRLHTWTSLVCTAFLLMLCVTGLPLVFHDEIDAALNPGSWTAAAPGGDLLALDAIVDRALDNRPGEVPLFMSFDHDRPVVNVTTGPTPDAPGSAMHFASFDRTSGNLVPPADRGEAVMHFLLQLHTDMFLGVGGMLFLGFMGILFVIATVSGVVLYAPFMRRYAFGTVRSDRSPQLKWLDWHNLLGIVTVAWVLVVGITGVVNSLAVPIIDTWKQRELADLIAGSDARSVTGERSSLDAAVAAAQAAAPRMTLQFVAFPGGAYSTNAHYAIFLHGNSPLTRHLATPVLVDATTGRFEGLRAMPWYVKTLALSQPLHFGDFGGLPLKLLWAALTAFTLVILVSGLYLWFVRRGARVAAPETRGRVRARGDAWISGERDGRAGS